MKDSEVVAVKALDSAVSAHKRIDDHGKEISSLRASRHEHNSMLHNQGGILMGLNESVKLLSKTVSENTKTLVSFKAMAMTVIFMGGCFISFCVFAAGKILGWF